MRRGRNIALQEFRLVDEMPFCPEESGMEDITSALDQLMIRRVDNSILNNKRRRLQSRKQIEKKEIDDVVVKALMRLSNAVQDCFAFEHQAKVVKNKVTSRKITRNVRESKSKQLFRKKILEETQTRTVLRQRKIQHDVENKIREATATAIANRQEEIRSSRKERSHNMLQIAEQEFERIARIEEEDALKKQRSNRISSKARVVEKRKVQKESVAKSLATLRRGMDNLDCAADAMLNRRLVIKA
ncbi:hypothetical protein TRFO_28958 [Tritrichomonas foetus]|uniref:Uncharacterized protein n=1 Tax=Tritrichomonas foetus TaxID=1144522 RepID=A0A1J4JWV7_9EUKA|nr:hypothetical protein TRFO_28958 [Tritrichomonas foetus]|eukprot:OHT03633.1 hypothetical protein TRFO_28958 [Tritrichomonas foetus]